MSMSDDTAARLRALASAASIGPWSVHGNNCDEWYVYALHARYETLPGNPSPVKVAWVPWSPGTLRHEHDAAYIAAASPDVVLRLLDALDEARRQSMDARNVLEAHKRVASEWHRRMQQAEAACAAAYEGKPRSGGKSVGRSLANMAAMHYRGERDAAVALLRVAKVELENAWRREEWAPDSTADALNRIDALLGDGAGGA